MDRDGRGHIPPAEALLIRRTLWFLYAAISLASFSETFAAAQGEVKPRALNSTNIDCGQALPAARKTLNNSPEDLRALKTIAACTREGDVSTEYTGAAKEIFEESRVLAIVPELLEMANIKDLVPVLKEVETKKGKSVADYLMMHELYDRIGDPQAKIRALEMAVSVDPNDPRLKLLLASGKMSLGDHEGARTLYREYLASPQVDRTQLYFLVYVSALAWPLWTIFSLTAAFMCLWALTLVRLRRRSRFFDGLTSGATKWASWGTVALIPIGLGTQFANSGNPMPLGLILLMDLLLLGYLLWPLVRPLFVGLGRMIAALFGVQFARAMAYIPPGWRVVVALAAIIVMGAVVPAINVPDLRYGAMTACGLLFFGTVGSLLVSFIRTSDSLRYSLRWIGIAATIPFLVVYLAANWVDIGVPLLQMRLPGARAIDGLTDYMIMWGLCVFLAIHLSRILADALVTPVREMMGKVAAIEQGDFAARVDVTSQDEIGALGKAVNAMAVGLARREYIEKTFSRYVDKQVAEHILGGNEDHLHIKAERRHGVVMFCDIRGFTAISERLEPEELINLLNRFFERMVKIINAHGGVIDKFIGDNIMSVWGIPAAVVDGERQALGAALKMMAEMNDFNAELGVAGLPSVGIGIGINAGPLVAGSLGSKDRMEYTVVGDTVNTAQRAEASAQAGQIIVTDSVKGALGDDLEMDGVEDRRVKGKASPVRLWLVKGWRTVK